MNIVDCKWEIANIGKRTVEISIGKDETIGEKLLNEIDSKYEYQVIKVDTGNIEPCRFLERNGFNLIETQIGIELKYKDFDFNDSLIKYIEPDITFEDVTQKENLEAILKKITPEMFISDRIAIDPHFGLRYSYNRYCNWIKTAFESKSASFYQMKYKGEHIGFSMYRIKDRIWYGDLGGIYPSCREGLGLLTACGSFIYMKQHKTDVVKLVSNISSNNTPVIPTFNHCHFNFKNFKYVFVKHVAVQQ